MEFGLSRKAPPFELRRRISCTACFGKPGRLSIATLTSALSRPSCSQQRMSGCGMRVCLFPKVQIRMTATDISLPKTGMHREHLCNRTSMLYDESFSKTHHTFDFTKYSPAVFFEHTCKFICVSRMIVIIESGVWQAYEEMPGHFGQCILENKLQSLYSA